MGRGKRDKRDKRDTRGSGAARAVPLKREEGDFFPLVAGRPYREQRAEYEALFNGRRVRVPKGAQVKSRQEGSWDWFEAKRTTTVTVHHTLLDDKGVIVCWAGSGGYWKEARAQDVELLDRPDLPGDLLYEVRTWGPTSTHGHFSGQYLSRDDAVLRAQELAGPALRNRRAEVWALTKDSESLVYVVDREQGLDEAVFEARGPRGRLSSLAERLVA